MKQTFRFFHKYSCLGLVIGLLAAVNANSAVVAARPTAENRSAAARVQNRAPTMQVPATNIQIEEPESEPDAVEEVPVIVDNKSSTFGQTVSDVAVDQSNDNDLRKQIQDLIKAYEAQITPTQTKGPQLCDKNLRNCMTEKCGNNFTKCATDSTVVWGNKMDTCRTKANCTDREYALLAPEILADRDMKIRTGYYDSVIDCGNKYNNCIFKQCGNSLGGCLSKTDEDKAISACAEIAKSCREQDSGLAARFMDIFGELRNNAVAQAKKDEDRLYELRNLMRNTCTGLGAVFDDRTLDCVYTVNFFAGDGATPMASKKLYAGDSFQCTPDWFGVDVTTYLENAQRITREQTSASSAFMGAGLGSAAGLWSSGAIGNAREANEAKKDAKEACEAAGKKWSGGECKDKTAKDIEKETKKEQRKQERQEKQ